MPPVDVFKTTPRVTEMSVRPDMIRNLTSSKAGVVVPLGYIPLLREDRVNSGRARVRFEMAETPRPLMNAINVTVHTHFIPFLAFPHFEGSLDQLNRSYSKQPQVDGGSVVDFFPTVTFDSSVPFWKTLGVHAKAGATINASPLYAYNALMNWRYRNRSKELPQRTMLDTTLAACFWKNGALSDVVPDFDQAKIHGELDLNIAAAQLPVKGIGITGASSNANITVRETGGASATYAVAHKPSGDQYRIEDDGSGFPAIYAELEERGITLNLSNIDLAKKTAAFAEIRKRMSGLEDDHIIDLLMAGIRVPDEMMRQPILLDRKATLFGFSQRYATDGASLDTSVTRGETVVDLRFRTPPMNTGGIVLITAEIVPEQLYERRKDHFLHTLDTDELPENTRDYLDPEKVRIVTNDEVDVEHSDPDGTFGYAPLNSQWRRNLPGIGGKFYRELGDAWSEDRQRIWEVEQTDPTLTEDFYLATNIHHDVFADTASDAFEITTIGGAQIVGNTVFGKLLDEDTGDYEALMSQIDTGQIDQEAA